MTKASAPPDYQPVYPAPPTYQASVQQPQPQHHSTTIIVQETRRGNCGRCHQGNIEYNYVTCCGILWSILLFPIGLLCLVCCRDVYCTNCGTR